MNCYRTCRSDYKVVVKTKRFYPISEVYRHVFPAVQPASRSFFKSLVFKAFSCILIGLNQRFCQDSFFVPYSICDKYLSAEH